jgi:hypothetical protein
MTRGYSIMVIAAWDSNMLHGKEKSTGCFSIGRTPFKVYHLLEPTGCLKYPGTSVMLVNKRIIIQGASGTGY